MSKCNIDACRLTSIKGLVKPHALSKSAYLYYTVEITLTTPSQFMTFTEPIQILADFAP